MLVKGRVLYGRSRYTTNSCPSSSRLGRQAELDLGVRISQFAVGLDEPEITSRFCEMLASRLDEASHTHRIEHAFLGDLRSAALHRDISEMQLRSVSRGLMAQA